MAKEIESPTTFVRLPDELRKRARKIANLEERPLASMLRILIREAIEVREAQMGKSRKEK